MVYDLPLYIKILQIMNKRDKRIVETNRSLSQYLAPRQNNN